MLTVAYDGTGYHGWQRQPDKNSIEDILDQCLTDLTSFVRVIGASRDWTQAFMPWEMWPFLIRRRAWERTSSPTP